MNEVISALLGVIVGGAATYYILRQKQKDNQGFQQHLQAASEQLLNMAKERLGSEKEIIKTDLDGKRDAIAQMVEEIRKQLKETNEKLHFSERDRVTSFTELKKELETHKQLTHELRTSAEGLKNVLSNNQTRGQFGERIAEDLLKMAGFVINQDYELQSQAGTSRPDITLKLPDGTKVNIDVKFPYQNLQKYTEANNEDDKKRYLVQFQRDVRDKIKQIATRDYINPDERTVDFAIAFIPNEMIFSYIYEHTNDIWEEAMSKKVVMAGPYSFVAMLRLIRQAQSNFRMQGDIHRIIALVQKFRDEYGKFSKEFSMLGDRLESANKQFQAVASTRDRQLNRVIDQIDSHQLPNSNDEQLLQ